MSTIRRSPGSAPSTEIGPESTCTLFSGAWRMSSAESSLWIAPSNHSRQSTRKTWPGRTCTWAGTSGCQRLWPTICCSVNDLLLSSGNTFCGIGSLPVVGWVVGRVGVGGSGDGVVAGGGRRRGGARGGGAGGGGGALLLPAGPRDQGGEHDDPEDREADRERDTDPVVA